MSTQRCILLGLAVWLAASALAAPVAAQEAPAEAPPLPERRAVHGDVVRIFSGDVVVPADTVRHGTVVSVGRDVVVEGEVDGDVVVVLGSLRITGEVDGNAVAVLSDVEIPQGRVHGQLVSVLSGLDEVGAEIGDQSVRIGLPGGWFPGVWALLAWIRAAKLLIVFLLLVLLLVLVPDRVRTIADEAPPRYVLAFLVGLLGYLVLLLVLPLIVITLVGIPVFYLVFYPVKWLGIAGIFFALGRRVGRSFGRELSPFGSTLLVFGAYAAIVLGLGAAGLPGLVALALLWLPFWLLFEVPGLGLALLTRLGARTSALAPAAPAPAPAPPVEEAPPA